MKKYELLVDYSVPPTLHRSPDIKGDYEVISHPRRRGERIVDLEKVSFIRAHDNPYPIGGGIGVYYGLSVVSRILLTNLLDMRVLEEILKHPEKVPPSWTSTRNSGKCSDTLCVADFHGTVLGDKTTRECWISSLVGFRGGGWNWDLSSLESRHWHWTSFGAVYPKFPRVLNPARYWWKRWPEREVGRK